MKKLGTLFGAMLYLETEDQEVAKAAELFLEKHCVPKPATDAELDFEIRNGFSPRRV